MSIHLSFATELKQLILECLLRKHVMYNSQRTDKLADLSRSGLRGFQQAMGTRAQPTDDHNQLADLCFLISWGLCPELMTRVDLRQIGRLTTINRHASVG